MKRLLFSHPASRATAPRCARVVLIALVALCLAAPVRADGWFFAGATGGGGGDGSLADVEASTLCDLDATVSASYGGSGQTWSNLVTATGTAYDFYLGETSSATTDDPTFTGSAGDSGAYFAMDGADYFALASGTNPDFFRDMHKTTGGSDFWFAFAIRTDADGLDGWFNTMSTGTSEGISFGWTTAEGPEIRQRGSSTTTYSPAGVMGGNTDHIFILSHSHSGNTSRIWRSSTTANEGAQTFSTTTTDASAIAHIGARYLNNNGIMGSGFRVYGFYCGDDYLDNTRAAAIIAELESRHARDYTP